MGFLLAAATLPVMAGAVVCNVVEISGLLILVWLLTCGAAAGVVTLLFQMAGTLLGGIMLLFFVITGQHFLAGGFLPMVFLPATIQRWAA